MSCIELIEKDTVAQAWEELVITLWHKGYIVPKYGKEMAILVKVREPFKEPRVHKGDPNAVFGLRIY